MRVICAKICPSVEDLELLGESFVLEQDFGITLGKEYLVLGLTFFREPSFLGVGPVLLIEDDDDHPAYVPLCLFEVADARVSAHWEFFQERDGAVSLWPPSFHAPYYIEDFSEGVPEVVADYKKVRDLLKLESGFGVPALPH